MKGKLLQRVTKDIAALGSPKEEAAFRAKRRLFRSAARLRRAGGSVIERLVEATTHPNPQVRYHALWVLAATRAPGAHTTILALTHDPDAAVRYDAAMALGRFGYGEAVEPLLDLIRQGESDDSLGSAAGTALMQLGRPAVLPLLALLQEENPWVRQMAVRVLGGIRDQRAIEPVASLLKDPDQGVRRAAVEALEETGDPDYWTDAPRPTKQCNDPRRVDHCFDLIAACEHDPDEWMCLQAAFWRKRGFGETDEANCIAGLAST
jgi:HEAT repeat protein